MSDCGVVPDDCAGVCPVCDDYVYLDNADEWQHYAIDSATCSRESCDRPVDPDIDPDLCPGHRQQAENVPSGGRL